MGLAEYLEGAPEPDPQFILPPEKEEVYDEDALIEDHRRSGRNLKLAYGSAISLALLGGGVLIGIGMNAQDHRVGANVQQSPSAHETQTSLSPSPSVTESPTPSFSTVPQQATPSSPHIARSPSHIPSPSITESKKVTLSPTPTPTPTPEASTSVPSASCVPNENAPGEVVCNSPVKAYKDGFSDEVVFEITGGAAPNCANIQGTRVEVALANAVGFARLVELGNPC